MEPLTRWPTARLAPRFSRAILGELALAVFVFNKTQLDYANGAAARLVARVRQRYNVEFLVALTDHLNRLRAADDRIATPVVSVLSAPGGEPFHLHVVPLTRRVLAVMVHEVGADVETFRSQYRLSRREAQVAELVAHGYRTREIADLLKITQETAKSHLKRVYEKVGVDSRVQLVNRLH